MQAAAVVGLIGHARAGKTRLAEAIVDRFGDASVVGFGDAVQAKAQAEAPDRIDRDVLINVGASWVADDPEGFCLAVLERQSHPSQLLVVDGIHHGEILDLLSRIVSPTPIRFVLLKAPEHELIARFEGEGRSAEQAASLLSDSTEVDVDRVLLAKSDLVLDGTQPLDRNADLVVDLAQSLSASSVEIPDGAVGGLDAGQRQGLVEAVAGEWKWLLPAEAAAAVHVTVAHLNRLRQQRHILALSVNGALLYPSFDFAGDGPNPTVAHVAERLTPVMSDWEIVAWLIANNGYLDGRRPIDEAPAAIKAAVDAELSYA